MRLLCFVKTPDDITTIHCYLLEKFKQFSTSLLLATVGLKISRLRLLPTITAIFWVHWQFSLLLFIGFSNHTRKEEYRIDFLIVFSIYSSIIEIE